MKKILILILSLLAISYLIFDELRLNKITQTKKNNYNEYAQVVKDTSLYKEDNNSYIEIGNIKKDTIIELNETDYKDDYFKLKDTNYYILYKDIKKYKGEIEKNYHNYIPLAKAVLTSKTFSLSDKIEINEELQLPLVYIDEKYYVLFNNNLYSTSDIKETVDIQNSNLNETDKISVLYFKSNEKALEILNYLKENNYYMLTLREYKLWLDDKLNLKDNAVLLISDTYMSDDININDNLNLVINNKPSSKKYRESINSYEINNTDTETIKKILNKEEIITDKALEIAVLNYHFFYDEKSELCDQEICLTTKKFEEHLKYLKENGYKTLTIDEFISWIYGEIELPKKSVLLTVDDGAMGTSFINGNKLIPLLEKYDLNATLFLVTAWWDKSNYISNNLNVESHGDDIHKIGTCGLHNIKCLSYDGLYSDFKTSIDKLNSNKAFCFPFYIHTNESTRAIKDLGFKVAFGGGEHKATRTSNKYYLPRYVIYNNITIDKFIKMIT